MSEVWQLYNRVAAAFDHDRTRLIGEEAYLDAILRRLEPGPISVLDLGCGTGVPIAHYMIERGCQVVGVDAAPAMIARAERRFPRMTWLARDMRGLSLGRAFDALIAWNSFFHLTAEEQHAMFPVFREHAASGGLLLFTSGPEAGIAHGSLYGHDLFHASLSAQDYRRALAASGFAVLIHRVEDPNCGGHTVWLAERAR